MVTVGVPFLTQIDPRAKLKGSVDPLGLQPLWTRLGRRVIRNLTTVTTSLREFTTLLLGFRFAEILVEERGEPAESFTDFFLKFEQIAAYSLYAGRDVVGADANRIRGIQRVQKRLSEASRVRISAHPDHQILANQRTYGLWGLYSIASANSGFLSPDRLRLSDEARTFVDREYLNGFRRGSDQIVAILLSEREIEPRGRDKDWSRALAEMLGRRVGVTEKGFYARHLVAAGDPGCLQDQCWSAIAAVNDHERFAPAEAFCLAELREITTYSRRVGWDDLAERLDQIRHAESLFAPAGNLFYFLLANDGRTLDQVAGEVKTQWGTRTPRISADAVASALDVVADVPVETRQRLVAIAQELEGGNYCSACKALIAQNENVMRERGGIPWARLSGANDRIDVRLDSGGALVTRDQLKSLWVETFFLNALKQVGFDVMGGR